MHLEIEKAKDYTFTLDIVDYNIQSVPSACTVTIYDNGGTSASTGSATIATDGTLSYTFSAADNDTQAKNFRIKWSVTVDGAVTNYSNLFDVVLVPINNLVNDEDIFLHCQELRDISENIYQTSSDGTISTLISNRFDTDNREWKGGSLEIYLDDTTTHNAKITAYSAGTNTVTFTPAYSTNILSGKRFKIRSSYQRFINEAFDNFVYRDTRKSVSVASGYLSDTVLRNLTIYKALVIIAQSMYEVEGDKWWLRYNEYQKMYDVELASLDAPYDNDGGGSISDSEDGDRPSVLSIEAVR